MESPPERGAVIEMISMIHQSKGVQTDVDSLLSRARKTWSKDMVVAHRAAMVGRLVDVGLLEVTGRGVTACIRVLPGADLFVAQARPLDTVPGDVA